MPWKKRVTPATGPATPRNDPRAAPARRGGALSLAALGAVLSSASSHAVDLHRLEVPPGFRLTLFAQGVDNARQMARAEDGTVFAGSREAGNLYALPDRDGDHRADEVITLATGLRRPSGIALKDGDLYVADVSEIIRFPDILGNLHPDAPREVVYDDFPGDGHHGWKYLRVAPDGRLTVPVGAPCNLCDPEPPYAALHLLDVESGERELIARGIRNTLGFDYHPETGQLWFTENGTDMMGDTIPLEELNRITRKGQHFGYPHVYAKDLKGPKYGEGKDPDDYRQPVATMPAHFAPLGMTFYRGDAFPEKYRGSVIIAEHGSWNRDPPGGYRVTTVLLDGQQEPVGYEVLVDGWLERRSLGHEVHGRPADVMELPDGSLLISDDHADVIYRLQYRGEQAASE